MHTKFGKNKSILELEKSIKIRIDKALYRARDLFLGKCTKYKTGKMKGRWGKINSVLFYSTEGLLVTITPFSKQGGHVGKLMVNSDEATKMHKLSDLDVFSDYATEDMIKGIQ